MAIRPYRIRYRGQDYMIEAPTAAQALSAVTRGDIEICEAASGADVAAWARAGKTIDVFDAKLPLAGAPAEPVAAPAPGPTPEPSPADAGVAAAPVVDEDAGFLDEDPGLPDPPADLPELAPTKDEWPEEYPPADFPKR